MATKLTQGVVDKIHHDQKPGKQIYDASVSGLRIVVGKNSVPEVSFRKITDEERTEWQERFAGARE